MKNKKGYKILVILMCVLMFVTTSFAQSDNENSTSNNTHETQQETNEETSKGNHEQSSNNDQESQDDQLQDSESSDSEPQDSEPQDNEPQLDTTDQDKTTQETENTKENIQVTGKTSNEESTKSVSAPDFLGGTGTQSDPYHIYTPQDLYNIRDHANMHFIQMGNIDMSTVYGSDYYYIHAPEADSTITGYGFDPICYENEPFSGSYNGNSFTISNLYISITDNSYRRGAGLFGIVENATITNVTMVNVDIHTESNADMWTGAIAGQIRNTTIDNCTASGNISGDEYTGGIVGYAVGNGVIKNSTNTATVTGGVHNYATEFTYTGGIVGQAEGTIENCSNTGTVTGAIPYSSQKPAYAGGIAGSLLNANLTTSNNTGEVKGTNGYYIRVAGIAGLIGNSSISNSTNKGNVTIETSNPNAVAAGIVAREERSDDGVSSITDCRNQAIITASSTSDAQVAGIIGYLETGIVRNSSNSGALIGSSNYAVLAGGVAANNGGEIVQCSNSGDISAIVTDNTNDTYIEAGGVVGNMSSGSLSFSYNTGNLYVNGNTATGYERNLRLGGVVGRVFNAASITNVYNAGNIVNERFTDSDTSNIYTAGIVGMVETNTGAPVISGALNLGTIDSEGRVAGGAGFVEDEEAVFQNVYTIQGFYRIVGSTGSSLSATIYNDAYTWSVNQEDLSNPDSFPGFDFSDSWEFKDGSTYPTLKTQEDNSASTISGIQNVGITAPYTGGTPMPLEEIVLPSNSNYSATNVSWEVINSVDQTISTFETGGHYKAVVTLRASGDYIFSGSTVFAVDNAICAVTALSVDKKEITFYATFPTVEAPVMTSISLSGQYTTYFLIGDVPDFSGMIVTAYYDNYTSKVLDSTEYTISDIDTSTELTFYDRATFTVSVVGNSNIFAQEMYTVNRRTLTSDDLNIDIPVSFIYDGNGKSVNVTYKDGIDGGAITVYYVPAGTNPQDIVMEMSTTPPSDKGNYDVVISTRGSESYNYVDPMENPMIVGSFNIRTLEDVNGDSYLNSSDLQYLFEIVYSDLKFELPVNTIDINGDSYINSSDLQYLFEIVY